MDIEIHPSAEANFNDKAESLISCICECPREKSGEQGFSPDIHIVGNITDEDIIGEINESTSDYKGRTIARFFSYANSRYGLLEEEYSKLLTLSESIQGIPSLRSKLGIEFVSDALFDWVKARFKGEEVESLFVPFLLERAKESIKHTRIIIPINNFVVEAPFKFGGSIIANISKSDFDKWESGQADLAPEYKNDISMLFDRYRKDFQGYAAVITDFESEPDFARQAGLQKAIRVTELLGIFSEATVLPDIKCSSRVKGMEMSDGYTVFSVNKNGELGILAGTLNTALVTTRFISKANLKEYGAIGLGKLSHLEDSKDLTAFEKSVLTFSFLYSKAAFTSDPMEKIVYMLSALESMLLKSESEPIQQNLAERIAFVSTKDLSERKAIIKNIRGIYGLRSKYLHHGISQNENTLMLDFLHIVRVFFSLLLASTERFDDKNEFLQDIDDLKLS